MKSIIVYDINLSPETQPADSEIGSGYLRVSTLIYALGARGARIRYLNLHRDALTFMESPVAQQIMRTAGMDGFPCMTVDDQIVVSGRYPTNEEIQEQLDEETMERISRPIFGGCNGACSSCHVSDCGSAEAAAQ